MVSSLWNDIRYGARGLRHNPGFTAMAVLAIALGIGVNTGIFSVLNGIALRPLPAADPNELVSVYQNFHGGQLRSARGAARLSPSTGSSSRMPARGACSIGSAL